MKIVLGGKALVATFLLARAVLPVGLWPMAAEIAARAIVYVTVLNLFLLPGHLTQIVMLARKAVPAYEA